jgi:hypothetical protein
MLKKAAAFLRFALRSPSEVPPYLRWKIGQLSVKKVTANGKVFFRYKGSLYPEYLHRGNAASHILEKANRYCTGRGLDIGAGSWPFPGAVAVDDDGAVNAFHLERFAPSSMDYIFSSHCLEHLEHWDIALELWISKLKNGGILFLYLPHVSMKLWRPGAPWAGSGHKWSPTHQVLLPWLRARGMQIVEYNPGADRYWSFHVVARKAG